MTDQDALLAAVLDHPDDDTPRLVYADWLTDHSPFQSEQDHATFIRAHVEIARRPARCERAGGALDDGVIAPRFFTRRCRCATCQLRRVAYSAAKRWITSAWPLGVEPVSLVWTRGFVSAATLDGAAALARVLRRWPLAEAGLPRFRALLSFAVADDCWLVQVMRLRGIAAPSPQPIAEARYPGRAALVEGIEGWLAELFK